MRILLTPLVPTLGNDVTAAVTATECPGAAAGVSSVMNHASAVLTAESNETFGRVGEGKAGSRRRQSISVSARPIRRVIYHGTNL